MLIEAYILPKKFAFSETFQLEPNAKFHVLTTLPEIMFEPKSFILVEMLASHLP